MTIDLDAELGGLPRVETALHGPAHPDEFRVDVGQWGDRWYMDNLPACDLAPACDDVWPSVSTIKKAADRDWSYTSLERAATYLETRRGELDGLNTAEILGRLLEVNKAGLGRASDRGTTIHNVMEALATGQPVPPVTGEAEPYLAACQAWLDKHQPEWLLSEVVVINREVGYGGTFDAVVRLDGEILLVDWKTRKANGKHAAYPEEGWQLAAYAHAEYVIVDSNGDACRAQLPHLDGGLIVSIKPDGTRPYPVDIDEGWAAFQSLRQFWQEKQRKVILRPRKLVTKAPQVAPDDPQPIGPTAQLVAYRAWILGRLEAVKENPIAAKDMATKWPAGVPGLRTDHPHTEAELERIAAALDDIETVYSMPFPPPDPRRPPFTPKPDPENTVEPPIDEGRTMDTEDVLAVLKRVDALPSTTRMAFNAWAAEAHAAGHNFSIRLQHSQRRFEIYRACLALAPLVEPDGAVDHETLRACIAHATNNPPPVATVGAAIGTLTLPQAANLADTAAALTNGQLALHYTPDGAAYLTQPKVNTNQPEGRTA